MAGRANKSCKSQDRWASMPRYTTKMGQSVCRMDWTQGHQGQRLQARENIQAHIKTSRNLMLGGRIMRACPTKANRSKHWQSGQTLQDHMKPPRQEVSQDRICVSYMHSRTYVFLHQDRERALEA